tara:strand:- start:218 stop:565 length:348 start_codon:yes stop_codon:yes gene_type:complete
MRNVILVTLTYLLSISAYADGISLSFQTQLSLDDTGKLPTLVQGNVYAPYTPDWRKGYQDITLDGKTYRLLAGQYTNCNYVAIYRTKPDGSKEMEITRTDKGCTDLGILNPEDIY